MSKEFEPLDVEDGWDHSFATDLVGCTLLIGLTYVEYDETLIRREQRFGTVISADPGAGIVIHQSDGTPFTIAPVLNAVEPAAPGIYQLADSDQAIEDPDFTALLTVRSPLRS